MYEFKKFAVRRWHEAMRALHSKAEGNIRMHHIRIEVQKAHFQYIKVQSCESCSFHEKEAQKITLRIGLEIALSGSIRQNLFLKQLKKNGQAFHDLV